MTIPEQIEIECENIKQMLLHKNRAYGNSFADPVRIFSKSTPEEALLIRIDDKLSRIARGAGRRGRYDFGFGGVFDLTEGIA